tara:strand:- start:54 stop:431 length:378 start_codon:yes stop_codon:yes gene_type:complete
MEEEFIEIDFILSLLKPNAQKIFNEVILARKNKMWSTTIIFSLAILDNIFNDEEYLEFVSGLDVNEVKFSKEIGWLRKKRNEILHYENPEHKITSIILTDHDLKLDSEKAYNILIKNLIFLFPKQ